MKSVYEPPKDTSEDLLKQILDQNRMLKSIDNMTLNQLTQVFKIPENAMMDRVIKLNKIKQKLIDIIIDQKQQCVNYLTLPKFKNVSENSKNLLKDVMLETWASYQKRNTEEQKGKKCERYLCRTQNMKQAQQFHLGLFQFVKNCYFFDGPFFPRPPMGNFPGMMTSNDPYSFPNMPIVNQFYPMANNSNGSNVKVEEPKSGVIQQSYNNDIKQIREKDRQKQRDKQHKKIKSYQSKQKKTAHDKDQEVYRPDYEKSRRKQTKYKPEPSVNPFIFKAFLSCCCKGKRSQNQKYFECQECLKKFHFACLNIPTNAVARPNVKKICPQCSLQNTNCMYKVIQPLQSFWSDDKQLQKQKITVKSKKNKQILQKKYSLQFKFIKVEGWSMFTWDLQNKKNSTVKQQNEAQAPQPRQVLNQILIKDEVLSKGIGEDLKISLNCMKNTDSPILKSDDKKPTIIFVSLNIVQPKTLQEILSAKYQYFQENYLDKFFTPVKNQIKIQILDTQFKLLNIPVRGSDCQHPDLYDLSQFVRHCLDLHSQCCFYCSKKCKTFKIDPKVERQIKKIRQQIKDQSQHPSVIYYQRNGTFRWQRQANNEIQLPQINPHAGKVECGSLFSEMQDQQQQEDMGQISNEDSDENNQNKQKKQRNKDMFD